MSTGKEIANQVVRIDKLIKNSCLYVNCMKKGAYEVSKG